MIIPQSLFDIYNKTTSDFITSNFGVNCAIIYGSNKSVCPNCVFNTLTKSSSNIYKSGGPVPFLNIICPYCEGVGYKNLEQSETIRMRVYFDPKDFIKIEMPNTLVIDAGTIQCIGFLTDLPKIQKCQEVQVDTDNNQYGIDRYNLSGTPNKWGLGQTKKYFIAFFNRKQ